MTLATELRQSQQLRPVDGTAVVGLERKYDRLQMANRNPARLIAPVALVGAVVGILAVVQASRSDKPSPPPPAHHTTTHARPVVRRARVYVVKPGDNLTLIAQKTHVDVETLQQLNPSVDPQTLRVGQRLKLVP